MKFIHSGKVKDVYELNKENLLFHFTDRVSAYDVPMVTDIKGKGEILCKFAELWFNHLDTKNHMVRLDAEDKMVVRKLSMIPLECVVRGYLYGSLFERYTVAENIMGLGPDLKLASRLREPIFDPTTKSQIHDVPISEDQILQKEILTKNELNYLKNTSIRLYNQMSNVSDKAGFIMADVKFEFGKDPHSDEIILADSLGPDEFRMWTKESYKVGEEQVSYDKQFLRDWLIKVGFRDKVKISKDGEKPVPPELPSDVVDELLKRYSYVYEKISKIRI
ncbi:MAG: phosphoribosylaminoimidazolesuccinocarboxamide synthase [Nitrososphaeraceae archaeon]|jgi:phosphoribosylaminoimidazole-succinocarboxamide synthase|nr:phosphoribosylaminoimidazolesuccinocarboxamide synthase [Nitrososphaeraceae archaeon]MDW0134843.1 phosphoribosylaminoimidazolesuccinocarboxamide synthase [Nitrososphaeraceae archaeon]MDW0154889.1 phosphoribosylaminoimidazolesuccinocarboxamide synthase [Nitrososphaeraceae archaeon]